MRKYNDMGCSEREEHHQDLLHEGFEWCPECGTLLDCHPNSDRTVAPFRSSAPIITGDYPPLTRDDLLPTA